MTAGLAAWSSAPLPASLGRLLLYTMAGPMATAAKGTIRAPGTFVPTSWLAGRRGQGLPRSRRCVHWAIRSPPEDGVAPNKFHGQKRPADHHGRAAACLVSMTVAGHTLGGAGKAGRTAQVASPARAGRGAIPCARIYPVHGSMQQTSHGHLPPWQQIRWLSMAISDGQLPGQGWQRPVWPQWARPCNRTADRRAVT